MSAGFRVALRLLWVPVVVGLLTACARRTYETVYPTLSDGRYDSEFPYRNCSGQLEGIAASLAKIDVLVFYQTYTFSAESMVTMDMVRKDGGPEAYSISKGVFSESVTGTALTIYYDDARVAYLSCAHIVDYPDTVVTRYPPPNDNFIEVMGIRARQQNNISKAPAGGNLEILAIDRKADVAILGKKITDMADNNVTVFDYPLGDSEELEWGSFVYIMGFPLGHAMITRGIVSDPGRIRKGTFLIDAMFNKGFSGGPVIAVRDGVPHFELVGMVRSSAALEKYYLAPDVEEEMGDISFGQPYSGEMKIVKEKDIQYGITFSVTTSDLRSFYNKYRDDLQGKGYDLDAFFSGRR